MYGGKALKNLRLHLGLSQADFSKELEVSQSYYSSLELSKKPITNKTLAIIESKWGVKSNYFSDPYAQIQLMQVGGNNGGKMGGSPALSTELASHTSKSNTKNNDTFSTLRESKQAVFFLKLAAYLEKNPDIQGIEADAQTLVQGEYFMHIVFENYLTFIFEHEELQKETPDEHIKYYYGKLESLRPFKEAFNHLATALKTFYKEMYKAGDTYFDFAKEY